MKSGNISIKWKLFLYLLMLVAILLVVLWLFQTILLDRFYKSTKIAQVKNAANSVKYNIDDENLQEVIDRLEQDENIKILLLDKDGGVLYTAASQTRVLPPDADISIPNINTLLAKAQGNGGSYLELSHRASLVMRPNTARNGEALPLPAMGPVESMVFIDTVPEEQGSVRYIYINARISPVNATVETLRVQLLYVTGVLIFLALLLALLISQKISKPIMSANETAKQLAKGNYNVYFAAKGYREIGELNQTLNTAAHELSRVENLRRELIANVSHDLRTPLTMISGFAEMIRDLPGENTAENAQVIVDESNRLSRLVSDLLDISKLQSGAEALTKSRFCITNSITDTIERIASLTGTARMIFEADADVWVEANENQILQVIYNLLTNAITHSRGSITVRQVIKPDAVRIEVQDQGGGIAKEDLAYVWDRYYKVDKTHKRAEVGTGLGLSIVKGVLDRHGGTYGVESELGVGSVFWFELKLKENI